MPEQPQRAVVLADVPERVALRKLVEQLEQRRDRIAELDLETESLREQLATFEAAYHARLAVESHQLTRIEGLVGHLERWSDLLARRERSELGSRARRIERRRVRETAGRRRMSDTRREEAVGPAAAEPEAAPEADAERPRSAAERLKSAYRALARRFHPDLARSEAERLDFSGRMAKINELYRAGDVARLETLAEQAKAGEIDDPELPVEQQIELLSERLRWFDAVLASLSEERTALERSPTCELLRNVQQAEASGRDLVEELRHELRRRIDRAYIGVKDAVVALERAVADFNRTNVPTPIAKRGGKNQLERLFDPYADKRLVRLGLGQVNRGGVSKAGRELAAWLEQEAAPEQPHVLRLVLLTYVAELSPFPLTGLESYDDLELRFAALAASDAAKVPLAQALVDADDLVEYGVRRATDKVAHVGLRFRGAAAREAVPLALDAGPVRRAFKQVLGVLGERLTCAGCRAEVFAVPLYKLRGLDDLRASVCPECGHVASSYWMAAGKDVQAVLNPAFVDYEIVSEWRFRLARASIAMQLVPSQVERMSVRDLKARLFDDVFARNEIDLGKKQLLLLQNRRPVADRTPLAELDEPSFVVRFSDDAQLTEAEALELLRHRIRNRFR